MTWVCLKALNLSDQHHSPGTNVFQTVYLCWQPLYFSGEEGIQRILLQSSFIGFFSPINYRVLLGEPSRISNFRICSVFFGWHWLLSLVVWNFNCKNVINVFTEGVCLKTYSGHICSTCLASLETLELQKIPDLTEIPEASCLKSITSCLSCQQYRCSTELPGLQVISAHFYFAGLEITSSSTLLCNKSGGL